MSKHLSSVMVAVLAAAMLYPALAFADHRPGNVVVMGGTLSLKAGRTLPSKRYLNRHLVLRLDRVPLRP